jgi:hypothetical protein
MGVPRPRSVALFLLVMSGLAYSVPLTQLSRATGKYLTISNLTDRGAGTSGEAVLHVYYMMFN